MRHLKRAVQAIGLVFPQEDRIHAAHLKRFGEAQQRWWRHDNVVGVCIARKRRNGRLEKTYCLQVLVRKKTRRVADKYCVPEELTSRAFAKPLKTDVRAVGDVRLESLVTEQRPAHPGFDVGNRLGGSGTLTCVVKNQQGERLGLSCAHVLAPDGPTSIGNGPAGTVLCPSLDSAKALGVLAAARLGLLTQVRMPSFDPAAAATNLDAALFAPNDPTALDRVVADINVAPTGINDNVTHGLKVHKVGAVSGETQGSVQATGLLIKIPYGNDEATFANHIAISSFTQPGDSGALVLDEQNQAVGLHLGSANGLSICTPIRRVLDAFGCQFA
jgi:hypothetical protein